jgi:hypothetical protein
MIEIIETLKGPPINEVVAITGPDRVSYCNTYPPEADGDTVLVLDYLQNGQHFTVAQRFDTTSPYAIELRALRGGKVFRGQTMPLAFEVPAGREVYLGDFVYTKDDQVDLRYDMKAASRP